MDYIFGVTFLFSDCGTNDYVIVTMLLNKMLPIL